jgi:fibronectin type 3 domain-containing protein
MEERMKMKWKSVFTAVAVMFIAFLMTGCGGGGGSSSPPRLSPPAVVSAAGGIGEVTVTWEAVAGATSYNIYHSTSPNVKKGTGTPVDNVTSGHSITGLAIGTKYYFVVTAVDANGESAESIEVSAAPVFPAPTDVRAFPGDTTATIRWTAVAGATSYNVYHSPTSPVTKTTGTKIPGANSGVSVPGLTNGTPHYFVVTAQANGLESAESLQVSATPTSGVPELPSDPTGVTGTAGAASATITWEPVLGASYNIYWSTSPGVTTATETKVTGAISPASVPNLIRGVPYYFVVTAENAAGESGVSNEVTVTPNAPVPIFSQADLAGTWNVRVLRTAPTPGWYSALMDVDNSGEVTIRESGGNLSPPDVSALSVESGTGMLAGVVKENGAINNPTFHGKMSSRKNLIVGISTKGTSIALHVYVKRDPGISYSSVDIANKSFGYQRIYIGSSHNWETAAGSTDASGRITLTSKEDSSGPLGTPPPNYAMFSITGSGVVTIPDNESTFSGVMTSDKNTIVGTSTDGGGKYSLRVIQMRGQAYTQADLEGVNVAYALHSLATPRWARGTWSTNLSGNVTVLDIVNSDGSTDLPSPWTHTIDAQGNVTRSAWSGGGKVQGMLSYGKDLMVEAGDYIGGASMVIKVQ